MSLAVLLLHKPPLYVSVDEMGTGVDTFDYALRKAEEASLFDSGDFDFEDVTVVVCDANSMVEFHRGWLSNRIRQDELEELSATHDLARRTPHFFARRTPHYGDECGLCNLPASAEIHKLEAAR